jgi:hypothetical protein
MNRSLILGAVAAAGLAGPALAQTNTAVTVVTTPNVAPFTINAGANFGTGSNPILHLGFGFNNLFNVAGLGVTGRVSTDAFGAAGFDVNADALVNIPILPLTLYVGPGLGYGFNDGRGFYGNAVFGATVPIFSNIGIYGEGVYRTNFGTYRSIGARAGLNISF